MAAFFFSCDALQGRGSYPGTRGRIPSEFNDLQDYGSVPKFTVCVLSQAATRQSAVMRCCVRHLSHHPQARRFTRL